LNFLIAIILQELILIIARSYLEMNNTDSALVFADKYINFYPLAGRLNPYNNMAFTLIAKRRGLIQHWLILKELFNLPKAKYSECKHVS